MNLNTLIQSATTATSRLEEPEIDLFGGPGREETRSTVVVGGRNIEVVTSEFWTSAQRQAHPLHEISYRACFKAQLPRFFVSALTEPGDRVYDPFMGRGTTLIEAALLGRTVAGNDANPLSRILVRPRLEPPHASEVADRLRTIPKDPREPIDPDLGMFYSPATLGQILALREYLRDRRDGGSEDAVDRWIRMVATNRLTGHSPGFFSVYTMPPNQAVSREAQRKINERRSQVPPDRDVAAIILRKSRQLLAAVSPGDRAALDRAARTARLVTGDARRAVSLPDASVKLIVTSPPFLDVVDYAADNWLRCWFNGLDIGPIAAALTVVGGIEEWERFVAACFRDFERLLAPGGWVAFEVGEVRNGKVRLEERVVAATRASGLECIGILVNQQVFTKTSNCWGVSNNAKGTNSNRIAVFRKPEAP